MAAGKRGSEPRANTSMRIMRPPQHGQGGKTAASSGGSSGPELTEQLAQPRDIGGAARIGEEAVMADAMKALRQDMEQEAADELVR